MSDWLVSVAGTPTGQHLALILALTAAFLHAVFGALQKGRHDPWLSRGAIDGWLLVLSAPIALFVVPLPQGTEWLIVLGTIPIHLVYKLGIALAFSRGAFTVVYPVVRGTGPLFAVIGAWLIFGETFTLVQWLGVLVLLMGIFGLAVYNLIHVDVGRETLVPALILAVGTGGLVALYTTYDAYGIRATPDPFTFLAWFFFLTAFDFPVLAALRWRSMIVRPALGPLLR
ncbi:EamA family transporter, partial [Actibacterium sp.]|uniref:EamA family transporter n=1 Tax=Actibacterium sp. TaxID=1872125 RepID=UPI00356AE19E